MSSDIQRSWVADIDGKISLGPVSLFFQIPYIAMPSNPKADRGYIDELLRALRARLGFAAVRVQY